MHDDSKSGCLRKSGERIREAFEQDLQLLAHRASNMLEISHASIHRILESNLKKKTYHIQVFHRRQEEDYSYRIVMCIELID